MMRMKKLFDQMQQDDDHQNEQGKENKFWDFSSNHEDSPISDQIPDDFEHLKNNRYHQDNEDAQNEFNRHARIESLISFDELIPENSIDISNIEHQRIDTINESECELQYEIAKSLSTVNNLKMYVFIWNLLNKLFANDINQMNDEYNQPLSAEKCRSAVVSSNFCKKKKV